ncbi:MAG: OsmC family protein [Smithellaceae bacterium]
MESKFDITFPGNLKVDAHFRGFTVTSDQPLEDGGDNTAPAPFELFCASIGMCAGFYIISFCQARAIPADFLKMTQTVTRSDETRRVEKIVIDIHVPPDFPKKYEAALIKAAETCSVKKFLDDPPAIEFRLQ